MDSHADMNRVTFTGEELLCTDSNYLHCGHLFERGLFLERRSGYASVSALTFSSADGFFLYTIILSNSCV